MNTNPDLETDIPQDVYTFFRSLNKAVESGDVDALHNLYEVQFENLTKTYYVAANQWHPWPSLRLSIVAENFPSKTAEQLYSFLYHKHLFTDRGVKQADAKASWATFTALFSSIAAGECSLPQWMLWDLFDEFVFQMTVVYQKRFSTQTEWAIAETFRVVESVISASRIGSVMRQASEVEVLTKDGNTRAIAGFFAVVTKSKINVLLGDYLSALADLKVLDIYGSGQMVLFKVSPAAVSLLYNVGFSYLMLHRYEDASNNFRRCLAAKLSGRRFSERLQLDAAYLYVCARVLGGMIVANVSSYVEHRKRAAFEDDRDSLRMGDEERFRDVFDRCSPKFLTVPAVSTSVKGTEGKELQARMFRRAVQQQQEIIRLRDYFGVYQNTKVSQLQILLECEDGYTPFFALKMRSRQRVHDGESADLLSGMYRVTSQNDCVVSGDNVEVVPCTNFGGTENKLYNKIKNFQRVEQRQVQRKQQNQSKPRREGGDKTSRQTGGKRQGNGNNNNNNRRPNRSAEGGQHHHRPNQQQRANNRALAQATTIASAPVDNLFNRNAS